jgi:DNA-binding response OmpR family regulator
MLKKILVAEDEMVLRVMLVDYLEELGFEVLEAEDGAIAFDLWTKEKCNLIITDINMPNLNGLELLKKVKETDPAFPVIVVTGVTMETAKSEANSSGANAFLSKPYSMVELNATINKILNIN